MSLHQPTTKQQQDHVILVLAQTATQGGGKPAILPYDRAAAEDAAAGRAHLTPVPHDAR